MEHQIHVRLPNGFTWANEIQAKAYESTGFVPGAAKVVFVRVGTLDDCMVFTPYGEVLQDCRLAVRLRPPRAFAEIKSIACVQAEALGWEWYITQYNLGWSAGRRAHSDLWGSGLTNYAWDDGYLDQVASRAKWHLAHCENHDSCGEG